MIRFIESLLLPPASLVLVALVGLLLLRTRWRRAGFALVISGLITLYLVSTPLVAFLLARPLDRYPALDPASIRPSETAAIVVLSGGKREGALEYGRDVAGEGAFERVRYGVWLQRRLGLPILVTGRGGELMMDAMAEWFGTEARWTEVESRNTHEHAVHCADLFRQAGIDRIYVVTHYWHMPRAMASFEAIAGVEVVAAPMGFAGSDGFELKWFLPRHGALCASAVIFHEWLGRLWYRIRYGY